mmetsp:Transcript_18190/g.56815  ORF Transcript_18190/g.56815 Transcript_18190/m.56815 type:complete len:371 (+) Transcript_18190:914-2026(+)
MSASPPPAPKRRKPALPRLVLHFDVNETIMVSDPAGGDDFDAVLNKMVAKTAFARRKDGGDDVRTAALEDLEWRDGVALGASADAEPDAALWTAWAPPGDGSRAAVAIPSLKKHTATFASTVGKRFRSVRDDLRARLALAPGFDPVFYTDDGGHHKFLPAFFETLRALLDGGRDVSLVIRTFGSDGPAVAEAVGAWAAGNHPTIAAPKEAVDWVRPERVFRGRYDADGRYALLPEAGGPALDEAAAVTLLETPRSAAVVQDHYDWWASHGERASAGKPFWITRGSDDCHHLFFDDHIKNGDEKSIVAARARESPDAAFAPLDGPTTRQLHGICLVRVPTLLPLRDENWFLDRVAECEARRGEMEAVLGGD